MADNPYRSLPSVNDLLAAAPIHALEGAHSHEAIVATIRAELAEVRQALRNGEVLNGELDTAALAERVAGRLQRSMHPRLIPVINATGIVLHTNLGRAPLAEEAAQAAQQAGQGYLNLELDLATGKRSSRQDAVRDWLCRLTGAESATAVNNNAAATVIVLRALCAGKEVIVSRPARRDRRQFSHSRNHGRQRRHPPRGRRHQYHSAVGLRTCPRSRDGGAHAGPHQQLSRVRLHEECAAARVGGPGAKTPSPGDRRRRQRALVDFTQFGFHGEPLARESIAAGADLVLFSGDKLLGGPQAGIIAGRKEWIQKIEHDPLMRAFRLDKMTLAALETTLRIYLNEDRALREIPVLRMLGTSLDELRQRAEALAERLAHCRESRRQRRRRTWLMWAAVPCRIRH